MMGYERNDGRGRGGYDQSQDRDRDRDRDTGYGPRGGNDRHDQDDRGFIDRAGDEVRSWFGDEEAERRRQRDDRNAPTGGYGRDDGDRNYGRGSSHAQSGYGAGAYGTGGDHDRQRSSSGSSQYSDHSYSNSAYGRQAHARDDAGRGRDDGGLRQSQHGADYDRWRRQQIEALDRDYDDYRRENQSKFDSEFGTWRGKRETQRSSMKQAKEHMEVIGSDGQHIGTVDHVRGDRILLTKTDKDAGGHHHSIPVAWIESVDERVTINKSADEAKQQWRDEEQQQQQQKSGLFGGDRDREDGPHILDRSFSGTYRS